MEKRLRNQGLSQAVTGLAVVVLAALTGVATHTGSPDWVAITTAIAGVAVIAIGLFNIVVATRSRPRNP
jgi:ABC-type multidrug transport system permease subunit